MQQIQLENLILDGQSIRNILRQKIKEGTCELFIGKYKVIKYIGRGNFGEVYKAVDADTLRDVAVKIIDIDQIFRKNKNQDVQIKLIRFLKTEELLMKKCHSANVIKLFSSFQNKKCKVFVLQYCNGGGLDAYIQKRGGLQQPDAILILQQIILGLAQLHRNKIIHRDLKPANILIHDGIFKLADFGFAKEIAHEDQIAENTVLGSRNTMAPQVRCCEPYGLKADIWSLGMIFFLMLFSDSSVDYKYRHEQAMKIARNQWNFNFKTVDGLKISGEVADFLKRTLVIDQKQRMNWLKVLEHAIFKKRQNKMPAIYINHDIVQQDPFEDLKKQVVVEQKPIINAELNSIEFQQFLKQLQTKNPAQTNENNKLPSQLQLKQLHAQYLQCRKAEFIFNQLILPLQRFQLLQLQKKRSHVQLMLLLCIRCKYNVSSAKVAVRKQYSENVYNNFVRRIENFNNNVIQKYQNYSGKLAKFQDKLAEMFKDKISKIFTKTVYQQKQIMLNGIEEIDYTREEQIKFTYERYMVEIINELKGNQDDQIKMKNIFKVYSKINQIKLEDIADIHLYEHIKKLISQYQ